MSNSRLKEVAERALTDDELFLRSGTDFVAVCSARKRDAVTSEFAARRRETFEGEIVFLFGDASSDDFLLLEEAPRGCAAIDREGMSGLGRRRREGCVERDSSPLNALH